MNMNRRIFLQNSAIGLTGLFAVSSKAESNAARIRLMDEQGMAGCFLFPTLGVGVEEALVHDAVAAHAVFHAFNEWMLDDWTFGYEDRIFAAPYVSLIDPDAAVRELG